MTTLREAAQQALGAMRCAVPTGKITLYEWDKAVSDLDAALAEPVQEPVAWKDKTYESLHHQDFGNSIPLYTAPPQRKPLSKEEIKECERQAMVNGSLPFEQRVFFARAIERAHGIT